LVLDDPSIQELVDAHQLYINPSLVIIRISYMNTVARIDPAFRILKLCLLLAQYLCDKRKYEKQGTVLIASAIKDGAVVNMLGKDELDTLLKFERFAADLLEHYAARTHMRDPGLAGTYMAAKSAFYARMGKLIADTYASGPPVTAGVTAAVAQFSKIEAKFVMQLRMKLTEQEATKLPEPMLEGTQRFLQDLEDENNKKKAAAADGRPGSTSVIKPMLLSSPVAWTKDGEVDKTVEYEAERLNFSVSGTVELTKKTKIGPAGRRGTIRAFSKIKEELWADIEFEEDDDGDAGLPCEVGSVVPHERAYVRTYVRNYVVETTNLDRQVSPRPLHTYLRTYARKLLVASHVSSERRT